MQDKRPVNENKIPNGYWEMYHTDGSLWYKINYINGEHHGLRLWFLRSGKIDILEYYAR